jgi:hypothetical protein
MNLETTRMRGRPRNRWQDEVREDGRIDGEEEWQETVYNRQERNKLLKNSKESSHFAQCNGMNYYTYHCVTIAYSIQYSNMLYRFVA